MEGQNFDTVFASDLDSIGLKERPDTVANTCLLYTSPSPRD